MKTNQNLTNMEITMMSVIISTLAKIGTVLTSIYGWLVLSLTSLLAYFIGLRVMFIVLGLLILADFIFGIIASITTGKPITSDRMRSTLIKVMVYLIIIMFTFAISTTICVSFPITAVFSLAALVELLSVIGNLLIIAPNLPFLRLFKWVVSGEIAAKLNINKEELEDILENKNPKD